MRGHFFLAFVFSRHAQGPSKRGTNRGLLAASNLTAYTQSDNYSYPKLGFLWNEERRYDCYACGQALRTANAVTLIVWSTLLGPLRTCWLYVS